MPEKRIERRLAAILAADIAGYSRMMGADEAGTLGLLRELRANVLDPAVSYHHGRLVKVMGDGALVEFASVVDAVNCAVAIQESLSAFNVERAGKPADHRADRRQSRRRHHRGQGHLRRRRQCRRAAAADRGTGTGGAERDGLRTQRLEGEDASLPMAANALSRTSPSRCASGVGPTWRARTRGTDTPVVALPDKPSIAVLPFDNMSGDREQEYFADGVVEAITAALSRIRSFFVIARNSAFTYKGKAKNVREIGRELGVAYLLEGSFQRAGDRVRITVQLIETASGAHLWAENAMTARSRTSSTCRTGLPNRSRAPCSHRSVWQKSSARAASRRRNWAPTTTPCGHCTMCGCLRNTRPPRRSTCWRRRSKSIRNTRWRWRWRLGAGRSARSTTGQTTLPPPRPRLLNSPKGRRTFRMTIR